MSFAHLALITGLCLALCTAPAAHGEETNDRRTIVVNKDLDHKVDVWLESSLKRIYPTSSPGGRIRLRSASARGASVSFQACFYNNGYYPVSVECSVPEKEGIRALVRRVGYVPMRGFTYGTPRDDLDGIGHVPGLVPDPLFPENRAYLNNSLAMQPFWITLTVPSDARVGKHELTVRMSVDGCPDAVDLSVELEVSSLVLKPRKGFPVTHWWNADGIADAYKVEAFGDEWFKLAESYLADMVSHGSNMIFVPLLHHRREIVQRPAQLLIVNMSESGDYELDWSRVRRFVRLAKKCGFEYFEWPHFWHMKITPQHEIIGADEPARVYTRVDGKYVPIVPGDAAAMDERWIAFLKQLLPQLRQLIREEGIEDVSYYHLSDEPGGSQVDIDNYRACREKLRELAPWTDGRVMDAMSDIRYGRMKLIDYPVPNVASAADYIAAGIPHWVYYCCGPVGLYTNRFFDTPLTKTRMIGMLCYRLRALGFLHWGYNYWYVMDLGLNPVPQHYIDPLVGTTVEPFGDAHVVYPGAAGPIDSIRWEVFAEGLQDYAVLQTAGVSPDDPMLAEIKDYAHFPRNEEWLRGRLRSVLFPKD